MSFLAGQLRICASTPAALKAIAIEAGVAPRQVAMARAGKPVCAGAYLALCGAAGIDPVDGGPRPIKRVSANVVWWLLSSALYITRGLRHLDQRAAARVIGVSPATVCRVEAGNAVSAINMIKVCTFIGVHPDGYTTPSNSKCVSRETPTETCCSDLDISSEGISAATASMPGMDLRR